MKQIKIIEACNVLNIISAENKLPWRVSRQLFDLRKLLYPTWEYWENERVKLVERYGETDPATGNISVTPENMPAFLAEKHELDALDVDIPGLPVNVCWPDDVPILPAHMWALDGIVEFVEA